MENLLGMQIGQPSASIHGKGQAESPHQLKRVLSEDLQQAPLAAVLHHDGRESGVKQAAHKGADVGMLQLSEGKIRSTSHCHTCRSIHSAN